MRLQRRKSPNRSEVSGTIMMQSEDPRSDAGVFLCAPTRLFMASTSVKESISMKTAKVLYIQGSMSKSIGIWGLISMKTAKALYI